MKKYTARTAHLSEEDREVLSTLHFSDSFPSAAFRSFDHQWKTNSFCCLGTKDKQTSLEVSFHPYEDSGKVLAPRRPQTLRLPPRLHLHLSHNPGYKCLLGHWFFFPAADLLFPTSLSDLERHKESWILQGQQRHTQHRNHRASPHQSHSRPGL